MQRLEPGLTGERTTFVDVSNTAITMGSGSVQAFATPAMIALMEAAAVAAIEPSLAEGQTSVGVALAVRHLAASPVGQWIRAKAELISVDGRKLEFRVGAWDEVDLIGEGTHSRVVVDMERFLAGMQSKSLD